MIEDHHANLVSMTIWYGYGGMAVAVVTRLELAFQCVHMPVACFASTTNCCHAKLNIVVTMSLLTGGSYGTGGYQLWTSDDIAI